MKTSDKTAVMDRETSTGSVEHIATAKVTSKKFYVFAYIMHVFAALATALKSSFEKHYASDWTGSLSQGGNLFSSLSTAMKARTVSKLEISHCFTRFANYVGTAAQQILGNPTSLDFDTVDDAHKAKIEIAFSLKMTAEQLRLIPEYVSWDSQNLHVAAKHFDTAAEHLLADPINREAVSMELNRAEQAIRDTSIILSTPTTDYPEGYLVIEIRKDMDIDIPVRN